MNWRLGIDLGTNSIGWSVFSLDNDNHVEELIDLGVRIFSDGRDPKTKEPLAVERRTARSQRKLIYRRKLRRKMTFRLLQQSGLFPTDKETARMIKSYNPYELRVKALDSKLEPFELGRVLFNLSVRRGFKSNRKDGSREETSDKESKSSKLSQKDMQSNLDKAIRESGYRTLGEFLWKEQDKNKGIRFVPDRINVYYPTRKMYEDEFQYIKKIQYEYFPSIDWDKIEKSIFDQRPLKPQPRGFCQFNPSEERTYKIMPCSQKLRILQEIRNLKYYDNDKKLTSLTENQDKALIDLLNSKEEVSFDSMRKLLKLGKYCTFNLEATRDKLKGNSIAVKMRNSKRFGELWDSFSLSEQDTIVETLFSADDDDQVFTILEKYDISDEQKKSIAQLVLPVGTTMLCRDISETLVAIMENNFDYTYTRAVESLGYKYADQNIEKFDILPYYGKVLVGFTIGGDLSKPETEPEKHYGKITNPTVHVALNQTRVVVNALIKEYGKPSQISIELSRDLKASREDKHKIIKKQNENKKNNERLNRCITDSYRIAEPNSKDRLKYRLWEELGSDTLCRRCIYCGKPITGSELFSGEIEIEHILPYSRTLLDAESNLTLAHRNCNAFKKERSPFEAFGTSPQEYNWEEIKQRADMLQNKSKRNKFSPDAMEVFEKDSGFIARQLTDNAYLSKMALRYLKCLVENPSDAWAVNGGMTKLLRDKWHIDSILKKKITAEEIEKFGFKPESLDDYRKNRLDHRHHAMDAVVIALTDRALVKEISTKNAMSDRNSILVPELPVNYENFVEKVKNIVVSFKPDHGREGKLSKETLLGKIKREEKIAINKLTGADINNIKNSKVKNEFLQQIESSGSLKQAVKDLKDIYPQIIIFKDYFVSKESILSLEKFKDIDSIVDQKIKEKLKIFIGNTKESEIKKLLPSFVESTGIKKVRCFNRVQAPIEIKGDVSRYLAPEDYFAAIIWQIPPKPGNNKFSYEALYIRRDQLDKNNKPKTELIENWKKCHHPASKIICILHKDDYLEFSDGDKFYKCRIAGYSATNNCIDIRPLCAVNDCADWLITTNKYMTESCWKSKKGQNFISVNVLFGKMKARFITVNPIGRVFRKN